MKSDFIRGHQLKDNYCPIFELTPEQVAMSDEACKPFINEDSKPDVDGAILFVSSADRENYILNKDV